MTSRLAARIATPPLRVALALFALYAIYTIPSLLPRWHASVAGFALLAGWLAIAAAAWPIAHGRIAGRAFWGMLVGVSVALRLAVLPIALGTASTGDPAIYAALARSLVAGHGLLFHDPFTGVDFRALYPPGYPILLAGLDATVGLSVPVIWASNMLFELGGALLVARIGARLGAPAAGRAAAWLFATWPTFLLAGPFAQKESLLLLLVPALALLLLRLRDRPMPGWRDGAAFGLLAAAIALVQPGNVLLPVALGLALIPVVGLRPLIALAVRAAPFALVAMLPWWIRNWELFGRFVPLTSTGGLGLWIGNNPDASGNWMALPPEYTGLPELEQSARAAAAAKAWMVAHPVADLKLNLTKLVRTGGVEQFTVLRLSLLTPPSPPALLAALFPLLQGALFALLAATAALAGRARRIAGGEVPILLLLGCAIQVGGFSLWFEFAERHRYFLMPMLFLIVGYGLAALPAPGRRDRTLAVPV